MRFSDRPRLSPRLRRPPAYVSPQSPAMETTASAWTEEELMSLPKDGFKRELIEGELIMSPAGFDHERIGARLLSRMMIHADAHALGVVCGSSLGCWMANEDLLCPDVSFISRSRLASTRLAPRKFFRGAPDLVVEIMSPFDTIGKVRKKMEDYFTSGARLAWVLNPGEKTVVVYRSPSADRLLRATDTLDSEDVLPGFRLPLAELFADLSFD